MDLATAKYITKVVLKQFDIAPKDDYKKCMKTVQSTLTKKGSDPVMAIAKACDVLHKTVPVKESSGGSATLDTKKASSTGISYRAQSRLNDLIALMGDDNKLATGMSVSRNTHRDKRSKTESEPGTRAPSLFTNLTKHADNFDEIITTGRGSDSAYDLYSMRVPQSMLDFGCGDGSVTVAIGNYFGIERDSIYGADIDPVSSVRYAHQFTYIRNDPMTVHIDLPAQHVDLITAFVSIHHIKNQDQYIGEFARVIKPGGLFMIREHNCSMTDKKTVNLLNYIHAVMMFVSMYSSSSKKVIATKSNVDKVKAYLDTIKYLSKDQLHRLMRKHGFRRLAIAEFTGINNPQNLYNVLYSKQ